MNGRTKIVVSFTFWKDRKEIDDAEIRRLAYEANRTLCGAVRIDYENPNFDYQKGEWRKARSIPERGEVRTWTKPEEIP